MNNRRNFLIGLFLIVTIFTFAYMVLAQETKVKGSQQQKSKIITPQDATPLKTPIKSDLTKEDTLREAQSSLGRSINILNIVASLMGVLVGLLTLVIGIATAVGFFEYKRWKVIRENIQKRAKESEDKIEQIEENAKSIKEILVKAEEDANTLRNEIGKIKLPPLTEKPSEEIKEKLDDFTRRLEFLEILGVSLKPEDYFNQATDFYFKGKYELALKAMDKTLKINPDNARAWNNKGVILGKLGRHDEARKVYDKAIELKPDSAESWYNKGIALSKLGRHDDALKSFEKAIEIKHNYAEAWTYKGVVLYELGRYDDALKAYDKAIEIEPNDADIWYNKACSSLLKGDNRNAISNLSKAIELDITCKEEAKKDKIFKDLWDDEDFKRTVS